MSGITRYAVIETALCIGSNLMEGEVFMVMATDHDRELAALREELDGLQRWRDLALRFDHHRIETLWHLKALVAKPSHKEAAEVFLSNPTLAAHEVVQRLTAAEHRNASLSKLLQRCIPGCRYKGSHTERALINEIEAALAKPTESGASES